jgi:peptidoglycan/LPS O-acetylase OafA/YrhL
VFVLNAIFLQTTSLPVLGSIPTFGTNGPLWSLANEFWYYILFPLIFVGLRPLASASAPKFLMLAAAFAVCATLPTTMVLLGLVWLMGAGVFVLNRHVTLPRAAYRAIGWSSAALFCLSLGFSRATGSGLAGDLLVGAAFSALLVAIVRGGPVNNVASAVSRRMANFSYTLYLTHFPLAAFLACWLLGNKRLAPSPEESAAFAAAVVLLLLYAFGISLLFENNTNAIQTYLKRRLQRSPALLGAAVKAGGGH